MTSIRILLSVRESGSALLEVMSRARIILSHIFNNVSEYRLDLWVNLGFCLDVNEIFVLLGCYAE
jgi:hypothetical protein